MIAGLILAAGRSTRTAPVHKLLALDRGGATLIGQTVRQVLTSALDPVWLVTGYGAGEVRAAATAVPKPRVLHFVHAADYEQGFSASLRAGLAALPEDIAGVMVCLGDMPFVTSATIDRLIAEFRPGHILVPVFQGQRGNPVLWDRCFVPELKEVTGDQGGRDLLRRHQGLMIQVAVEDQGVLQDFDHAGALAAWAAHQGAPIAGRAGLP